MSISIGLLVPTEKYEQIRSVFQAFNDIQEEKNQYQQAKMQRLWQTQIDSLCLTVQRSDGVIIPTGWIQIYDFAAHTVGDDELEIHAHVIEPAKLI